jgi:hypothetical protein
VRLGRVPFIKIESTLIKVHKTMQAETTTYTYQACAYYGVFYPLNRVEYVTNLCLVHTEWEPLSRGDDIEVSAPQQQSDNICISTTSDAGNGIGMVFVDSMTQSGDDFDHPQDAFLTIAADTLQIVESASVANIVTGEAIKKVNELYQILIKGFRARRYPLRELALGWRMVVCEWDLSSDSSEESDPAPVTKPARITAPKPARVAAPKPARVAAPKPVAAAIALATIAPAATTTTTPAATVIATAAARVGRRRQTSKK